MNKNKLIKSKLNKIIFIVKNQYLEMLNSGFRAIRNKFERHFIRKKINKINNKIFQKEFLQRISQIFKPTEIIFKKRFFNLLQNLQRKDSSIRIRRYEALKTLILNNKLPLRKFFNAFHEKSNLNFSLQKNIYDKSKN